MNGIDLNRPLKYRCASLRFFDPGEHHVTRFCRDDVLLLVYEGVLRFSEDGTEYEIHPGEYYIQRKNTSQAGKQTSDSPKYFYVHFWADWTDGGKSLPNRGTFQYPAVKSLIEELDRLAYGSSTLTEQTAKFLELLVVLYGQNAEITVADRIAASISRKCFREISLDMLAEEFHFSRNHIINLFKEKYRMTPFQYVNALRIKRAEQLLELTSKTIEEVAFACGFRQYSQFYKVFKSAHHMSPAAYRKVKRGRQVPEIHPADPECLRN